MMSKTFALRLLLSVASGFCLIAEATPGNDQTPQKTTQERKAAMTMQQDLAHREREVHWPQGFDPSKAD